MLWTRAPFNVAAGGLAAATYNELLSWATPPSTPPIRLLSAAAHFSIQTAAAVTEDFILYVAMASGNVPIAQKRYGLTAALSNVDLTSVLTAPYGPVLGIGVYVGGSTAYAASIAGEIETYS